MVNFMRQIRFFPAVLLALLVMGASGTLGFLLTGSGSGWQETSLGSAAADAMAYGAETPLAVLPAGAIRGNLRGGAVSEEEVLRAVDGTEPLATASLTERQLWTILEDGLSALTVDETERLDTDASDSPMFPQISGFTMRADVSAPAGERIMELCLTDGRSLSRDGEELLRLCAPAQWMEAYDLEYEPVDGACTAARLLLDYIEAGRLEREVRLGRIQILGTLDGSLMERVSPVAVWVALAAAMVFAASYVRLHGRPAHKRYGSR